MKFFKQLQGVVNHLKTNYPQVNTNNLSGSPQAEEAVLSSIKKFSGFDYNSANKFFTRDIGDVIFATENVELENIHSRSDLLGVIYYLNQAYDLRHTAIEEAKEKTTSLPKRLYTPPKEIQKISRKNIEVFLKDSYGIDNEKELFSLKDDKYKKVIYDLYRSFTGYIPSKQSIGGIIFSIPENKELKLRYNDLPDFDGNTSLLSHIREMRRMEKNTQELLKENTGQRMEHFKKMAQAHSKQRENKKDIDR